MSTKKNAVIFLAVIIALVLAAVLAAPQRGNIAHIEIKGAIVSESSTGLFGDDDTASADIVAFINEAEADPLIKGILLDINSGGGSAVASEEIARAVSDAQKPVVALIRDVGASGAYWAASSADIIVASPISITGSIGVTASSLEFTGLLEKYGVGYRRLVSGEHKDIGTPFRNLTPEEARILQTILDEMHAYFLSEVAKNRPGANLAEAASGVIYTGAQAQQLGLIDELGGEQAALDILSERADVRNVQLRKYTTAGSLFGPLPLVESGIVVRT